MTWVAARNSPDPLVPALIRQQMGHTPAAMTPGSTPGRFHSNRSKPSFLRRFGVPGSNGKWGRVSSLELLSGLSEATAKLYPEGIVLK